MKETKAKEFKITGDGVELATISCNGGGFSVKCTEEGMKLCKSFKGCC